MELADWWLTDKSLVHKLFKVLVPRFKDMDTSFTRLLRAPNQDLMEHHIARNRYVLELRGHPFPPLNYSNTEPNRGLISNVLLLEARKEAKVKSRKFNDI